MLIYFGLVFLTPNTSANTTIKIDTAKVIDQLENTALVMYIKGPDICVRGGAFLHVSDEHMISTVMISCLDEDQIDELIKGLVQARFKIKNDKAKGREYE
jgi:hypothetical protein